MKAPAAPSSEATAPAVEPTEGTERCTAHHGDDVLVRRTEIQVDHADCVV